MTGLICTESEPWTCTLPSVASFHIAADGTYELTVDQGVDAGCESMLVDHWIDPLVWWRRGYWLLNAAVMVDSHGRAVLISAPLELSERIIVALGKRGWSCLGDTLVPGQVINGEVIAHPRRAEVLASAALALSESLEISQFVRPGGNAVGINIRRWQDPARVLATATFSTEPPKPATPGIAHARIARGFLLEVKTKDRTPGQLLEMVAALAALPAWVSSDPLRAITDPEAVWAIADGQRLADKAREQLEAALDEFADWLGAHDD